MLALQAHLDGCEACRNELTELKSTAALMAAIDLRHVEHAGIDNSLPQQLGEHVVERVRDARHDRTVRRTRRRVGTIAAAVVGLAAALAAVVGVAMHSGPAQHVAAERTVTLSGREASAKATLTAANGGTDVAFHGHIGSVSDSSDPYWLWLTDSSGHRLAAATFRDGDNGKFSLEGHGAIALRDVKRVWVTDQQNHVVLDTNARG